uniref:ABC transporter permease subunit n=1 Tax=Dialister hominis TaxID=2582419 RepID=UPI003FEDFBCE
MIDFAVIPTALLFISEAIPNTLFMAFVSLFFGIVFGSVIALIRLRTKNALVNGLLAVFISFFRGVPSIVQLFIVYYSLPYLLAPLFTSILGHTVKPFDVSPYWTVYTTFILYNTVYQSENLRGALRSVDHGQYEAAVAMGMTPFRAFTRIVLPQAFVVAMPAFFTYYLKTIKLLALVFLSLIHI